MKLEVNQQIVSENATGEMIGDAIKSLHPDDVAIIIAYESDDIFLQAGGVPGSGFVMSYMNHTSGEDLQSKNHQLALQTVKRVFQLFIDGDRKWRQIIAWQKTADAKPQNIEKPTVSRKTKGLLFGCFLYLTFLYPLMAIAIDTAFSELIFKPMCAQYGVAVVRYVHSGGTLIDGNFSPPRCIFANGSTVNLSDIVGWNVIWLDSAMRILVALIPFTIPTIITLLLIWQAIRKRRAMRELASIRR